MIYLAVEAHSIALNRALTLVIQMSQLVTATLAFQMYITRELTCYESTDYAAIRFVVIHLIRYISHLIVFRVWRF